MSLDNANYTNLKLIMVALFEGETRRFDKVMEEIHEANYDLTGIEGFAYMGSIYRPEMSLGTRIWNQLPVSLHPRMEKLNQEIKFVARDKLDIHQGLVPLLRGCTSLQDTRDALPNCLVAILGGLNMMERQKEEAWTLVGNPRAMKKYLEIRPKIEIYCVSRLVY